jgi:hypothetical protein
VTRFLLAAATAVALAAPAAPVSAASCPETVPDCVWQAFCGLGCGDPLLCVYAVPPLQEFCISI